MCFIFTIVIKMWCGSIILYASLSTKIITHAPFIHTRGEKVSVTLSYYEGGERGVDGMRWGGGAMRFSWFLSPSLSLSLSFSLSLFLSFTLFPFIFHKKHSQINACSGSISSLSFSLSPVFPHLFFESYAPIPLLLDGADCLWLVRLSKR